MKVLIAFILLAFVSCSTSPLVDIETGPSSHHLEEHQWLVDKVIRQGDDIERLDREIDEVVRILIEQREGKLPKLPPYPSRMSNGAGGYLEEAPE